MGVLGGVFVLKSGLRILIRAPEVPFSVPPKTPKMGVFGYMAILCELKGDIWEWWDGGLEKGKCTITNMGYTVWGENGAMVDLSRESGADGEMLRVWKPHSFVIQCIICYTPKHHIVIIHPMYNITLFCHPPNVWLQPLMLCPILITFNCDAQ